MSFVEDTVQTFAILVVAYLFDRLMSLAHEGLHLLWGALNGSEFGACDIYFLPWGDSIPIGARETWHGVPQFHVCIGEVGMLPYHYNPLFATIGSVIIAMAAIRYSNRIEHPLLRWAVTAGAIYSGYRYALYSAGILNHPKMVDGELVTWLGDGGTILAGFGPIGMVPGIVAVFVLSVVTFQRMKNSRDVCDVVW